MSYGQFALVYDQFMAHAPYNEWVAFTAEIMDSYGKERATILDLGCGTGEIAIRLQEAGNDVIGVDMSAEMLSCAEQKGNAKRLPIQWMMQDIRELYGFSNVDVCISYCDVMNYITTVADLEKVFTRTYSSLADDGIFLFDIHHPEYAKNMLMDRTFADVSDELAYIWDCEAGDAVGEMFHHLTFFQTNQEHYIRFDETHHQRTFSPSVYGSLIKDAGFRKVTFYHDFQIDNSELPENSERIFIVAEK